MWVYFPPVNLSLSKLDPIPPIMILNREDNENKIHVAAPPCLSGPLLARMIDYTIIKDFLCASADTGEIQESHSVPEKYTGRCIQESITEQTKNDLL